MFDPEELKTRFTYHKPHGDQAQMYEDLRAKGKKLAELIGDTVPPSREQSLAITKLEESIMWANAGIARRSD